MERSVQSWLSQARGVAYRWDSRRSFGGSGRGGRRGGGVNECQRMDWNIRPVGCRNYSLTTVGERDRGEEREEQMKCGMKDRKTDIIL